MKRTFLPIVATAIAVLLFSIRSATACPAFSEPNVDFSGISSKAQMQKYLGDVLFEARQQGRNYGSQGIDCWSSPAEIKRFSDARERFRIGLLQDADAYLASLQARSSSQSSISAGPTVGGSGKSVVAMTTVVHDFSTGPKASYIIAFGSDSNEAEALRDRMLSVQIKYFSARNATAGEGLICSGRSWYAVVDGYKNGDQYKNSGPAVGISCGESSRSSAIQAAMTAFQKQGGTPSPDTVVTSAITPNAPPAWNGVDTYMHGDDERQEVHGAR